MGDHQGHEAVFGHDLLGQLQHLLSGAGIQRGGVLVKQQELGPAQRRHQQRDRLALAAGEQANLRRQPVLEPQAEVGEQRAVILALKLRHAPLEAALLSAAQRERQIFLQLHVRRGAHHRVLEHAADVHGAPVFRQGGDILAVEQDLPAVHRPHAGHGVEERGFARAVAADDGDEIAVVKVQIQVDERLLLVDRAGIEGLGDADEVKHRPSPPSFSRRGSCAASGRGSAARRGRARRSRP